ncbi:hypothetical protein BWQ96_04158 [Gracilariopsis chorda]|uniref:Uncharacterized protein n=1 Tax=Gracilariopsis chorda TaxID=448386 RepID=A0A2V3IV89_9FLOR|nr:hypothetical protein BWQ96_04158 [Gracilariopsis chorda]|eukprot:PXF46058.1 hypothetical protein BWQ96_04158 [Gracilariopsis chorda]
MEGHGYHRAIQGGGTGNGFKQPRQICEYEPVVLAKLQLQLLESFDVEDNYELDENEKNKRWVWKREAKDRLKALLKRKRVVRMDCSTPLTMTALNMNGVDDRSKASDNHNSLGEEQHVLLAPSDSDYEKEKACLLKTGHLNARDVPRPNLFLIFLVRLKTLLSCGGLGAKTWGLSLCDCFSRLRHAEASSITTVISIGMGASKKHRSTDSKILLSLSRSMDQLI